MEQRNHFGAWLHFRKNMQFLDTVFVNGCGLFQNCNLALFLDSTGLLFIFSFFVVMNFLRFVFLKITFFPTKRFSRAIKTCGFLICMSFFSEVLTKRHFVCDFIVSRVTCLEKMASYLMPMK